MAYQHVGAAAQSNIDEPSNTTKSYSNSDDEKNTVEFSEEQLSLEVDCAPPPVTVSLSSLNARTLNINENPSFDKKRFLSARSFSVPAQSKQTFISLWFFSSCSCVHISSIFCLYLGMSSYTQPDTVSSQCVSLPSYHFHGPTGGASGARLRSSKSVEKMMKKFKHCRPISAKHTTTGEASCSIDTAIIKNHDIVRIVFALFQNFRASSSLFFTISSKSS